MSSKNRFTILDPSSWSVQANSASASASIGTAGPVGEPRPQVMSTWSDLQSLVDATPNNGTVDLRGLGFEPANENDSYPNNSGKNLTFLGGYLTAARRLPAWVDIGGGVYSADVELGWLDDMRNYLVDPDQSVAPAMKVYPTAPIGYGPNRFSMNNNWLKVNSTSNGINNGTAQTDGGDDAQGELITGFTVTDPTLRNEITARINAVGFSSVGINIHAGPNVTAFGLPTAWDSSTGVMTFAQDFGIPYNGYLSFCMYGGQDLAAGEYSIDINNDKIYYRPINGDPQTASMPFRSHAFQFSAGDNADLTFNGTTFIGGSQGDYNSSLLSTATGGVGSSTLRNCSFSYGKYACYSTATDVERCTFERLESSAIITNPGCRIVNSTFRNTENKSAISNMGDQDGTTVIEPSLISGCYFSLPTTGHGQGISLYQDSWINTTVENCIFFNTARAMSFQPYGSDPHTTEGSMKFNNNLLVTTASSQDNNEVKSGQSTIAFNGAQDTALDNTQLVEFRHNTVFADENLLTGSIKTSFTMALDNLKNSSLTLESNIVGRATTAKDPGGLGGPSKRFANLFLPLSGSSIYGTSWGSTDMGYYSTTSDVFDTTAYTAKGDAATAAADGGAIGVRWSSIPTAAELEDITVDWTDTHIPQTLPRATSYSTAWGGDNTPPS